MPRRVSGNGGGGAPDAKAATPSVNTGPVYTVIRLLGSTSTLSLIAGTNANLSLSGSDIVAATAIPEDTTQTAVVREVSGQRAVEYPVAIKGPKSLVVSPATASVTVGTEAGTQVATITGVPAGATPSISPNDGRLAIAGSEAAGWKVVVGLTAASAGTSQNFAITAPGAAAAQLAVTFVAVTTEPTTLAYSVTHNGVPYYFYSDLACLNAVQMEVGATAEGYPFVKPHATEMRYFKTGIPSAQIAASFTGNFIATNGTTSSGTYNKGFWANGLMENPYFFDGVYDGVGLPQGFDEVLAYSGSSSTDAAKQAFDPSLNKDFGYTGVGTTIAPGDNKSWVKSVRKDGVTIPNVWRIFDRWSCLNVFSNPVPLGAYAPGLSALDKTFYATKSNRDLAVLGNGFVLPATKPNKATVLSAGANGDHFRSVQPYFGQNGERRRRYMTTDNANSTNGYSRDYAQLYADYMAVILADGQNAFEETMLGNALAFGAQQVALYERGGFISRGGAGQNNGHKMFVHLLGQMFRSVPGLRAKCNAIEGSVFNQLTTLRPQDEGMGGPYPNTNHYTFGPPVRADDVGRARWFHGGQALPPVLPDTFTSEFAADYELVSGIAIFAEMNIIASIKGDKDGSQYAAENFPAALAYYDFYRTVTNAYGTAPYTTREADFYDARRATFSAAKAGMTPDSASSVPGVTAAPGGYTWDHRYTGHSCPDATDAINEYSMDGVAWFYAGSGLTGSVATLVPGWEYYTRKARINAVGTGPRSTFVALGDQLTTARVASGSVTKGSRTFTATTMGNESGTIRIGDFVAGPGIMPGTYIASFGTGTGAAGTYNLSLPAYATIIDAGMFYTAPRRGAVKPTGVASGAAAWRAAPALHKRKYPNYAGPQFVAIDGAQALNDGDVVFCSMGDMTGSATPPTYQWLRNGVNIDGEIGPAYVKNSADNGKKLSCAVTSGGVTALSNEITLPGAVYPAMSTVEFASDYLSRSTALIGAKNGRKATVAIDLTLTGADNVAQPLLRFLDAAGTASTDNLLLLDRASTGRMTFTVRNAANAVVASATSNTGAANMFVLADGRQRIVASVDADAGVIQIAKGDALMAVTPSAFGSGDIAWEGMVRNFIMAAVNLSTSPGLVNYVFAHHDFIDLSVSANRAKFQPANIGNQGEGVFGVPALVMMYGSIGNWNAGKNYGAGGDFTMVGAVS